MMKARFVLSARFASGALLKRAAGSSAAKISAMQTIHLYKARKWRGWCNSLGSWNVGREFGKLAHSRFWDDVFPGSNDDPAKFLQLDGKQGQKYLTSRSGSLLEQTGHFAYLIMQKCREELGETGRKNHETE
ncbi:uncharacterized protein EDB91DRAFT_1337592 [Suillus paluster]|uniref:uncharacterized protein n=1 Tax=Suillus paluster TaxID=48578 RepID=UPI001B860925|nr:uncharacterized protein EDB91DRAFT_1337592 [Suillus paluster]KAG1735722.1 hypothetical protein EDB91DRAFT_1337592 [Suillus paluster]